MTARAAVAKNLVVLLAAPIPTPIGAGPRYLLPPRPAAVAHAQPVGRFRCTDVASTRELAHVELFARKLVLLLPAGIGISARCSYPVRTTQPTGVVDYVPAAHPTIGDLFAIWGQPLSAKRLASFRGTVTAWVGGKRWRGDVRAIPLRRHSEIVIEIGGYVPPHTFFLFPTTR